MALDSFCVGVEKFLTKCQESINHVNLTYKNSIGPFIQLFAATANQHTYKSAEVAQYLLTQNPVLYSDHDHVK